MPRNKDKPYIIAEAGTCHADVSELSRFFKAWIYIKAAARCGADAIKFQMFDLPNQKTMFCWIDGDEERASRWRQSFITLGKWRSIKELAERQGIDFLASVFEHETVEWLNLLKVDAVKVASRAAANFPYEKSKGPFYISTGMSEVEPRPDAVLFECESNYPSTAWWQGKHPGFSDHSGTPERAIQAIKDGCKLIEVHFYVDEKDAGPDLPASLNLDELKQVCDFARQYHAGT